jgi:hypothetical protein
LTKQSLVFAEANKRHVKETLRVTAVLRLLKVIVVGSSNMHFLQRIMRLMMNMLHCRVNPKLSQRISGCGFPAIFWHFVFPLHPLYLSFDHSTSRNTAFLIFYSILK